MTTRVHVAPLNRVAVTAFVACVTIGAGVSSLLHQPLALMVCAVAGLYLLFAIKVIQQWEKVALLRLGKYVGLRGPGLVVIVRCSRR